MDVQVVHHQNDFLAGKDVVQQFPDQMRPVVPCSAVGHFHPSPAEQRSKHNEQVGDAVALVFEVDDGGLTGPDPINLSHLTPGLLLSFFSCSIPAWPGW